MAVANRIARAIYKVLAGDQYREIGYQRAMEHEEKIKRLIKQLKALGVDIRHEDQQKIVESKKRIVVDKTGVQLA